MNELFFEKNRKKYLDYFSIDSRRFMRKRALFAVLLTVTFIALFFILEMKWLLWISLGAPVVGYKIPYYEVLKNIGKDSYIKEYAFPTFLRYFISLISTQGNVYQTLIETEKYTPLPIKKECQ